MTANFNTTSSQNVKFHSIESEHTLQSVSTVRNVGNSNIKETSQTNSTEEFKSLDLNKPMQRRNSTVAALTSKLIDIKSFKLSRNSNKHQKIVLKAVAKAPKRNIVINRKLFPSFSKTVDSDLGVLPAILTKNKNTLISPIKKKKKIVEEESNYVLKSDKNNNYYPYDDPLVNFSNPVELPITSTPEKYSKKNVNDLEKMIGDMDVYSMSYTTSTPKRMKTGDKKEICMDEDKTKKVRTMKIHKVSE